MKRMNLGCATDIKEDWTNVDSVYRPQFKNEVEIWDAREKSSDRYVNYDFILINHVLCTMRQDDAKKVLTNVREIMKDGGIVQIIDMDLLKAYQDYYTHNASNIPIVGDDPDYKLTSHISGYGTRLSLYTPNLLVSLLKQADFRGVRILDSSEYDSRPKESVIVEGIK